MQDNLDVNVQGFSMTSFTVNEVLDALLILDTKQATGADGLDPGLLVIAAPLISEAVTYFLFNNNNGNYPKGMENRLCAAFT